MLILRWLTRKVEHGSKQGPAAATGLIGVAGLDFLIDGMVIGLGFVSEITRGVLLLVALSLEALF